MDTLTRATVRRADQPGDFLYYKVDPNQVTPAEDAPRIGTDPGCFEWWYFDAILENGASVVVIFYTKPVTSPELGLTPVVSISVKLPGAAEPVEKKAVFTAKDFEAAKEKCDIRIGGNWIAGDLRHYDIHAKVEDVSVTMRLDATAPPVRIGTGHLLFDRNDGADPRVFGWLAPVPHGTVVAAYEVDGQHVVAKGTGYHDHNWGDAPMASLMHDWYWGRAQVDGVTVIATQVRAQDSYGLVPHTDLVLIRGDQFIACGDANVRFEELQVQAHPQTGKPVAGVIRYTHTDGKLRHVVTFERSQTIFVKQIGDLAYHRFLGTCTLQIDEDGKTSTSAPTPAMWEFMWLGSAPVADTLDLYTASMARPKG